MPISSERHAGFLLSKWERNYLKCRYRSHRNKIATAEPAIDATSPPSRPHVQFKSKKALLEERRQIKIMQENLRVLNRTADIMSAENICRASNSCIPVKRTKKSISSMTRKNIHMVFQWFLHKFGNYVPWWAHINY